MFEPFELPETSKETDHSKFFEDGDDFGSDDDRLEDDLSRDTCDFLVRRSFVSSDCFVSSESTGSLEPTKPGLLSDIGDRRADTLQYVWNSRLALPVPKVPITIERVWDEGC